MITAFVHIQTEPSAANGVAAGLTAIEGVAEVYSVTGEWDIIAIVRLADYDQLAKTVPDQIGGLKGIVRTSTVLAFRSFTKEEIAATWDIGLS